MTLRLNKYIKEFFYLFVLCLLFGAHLSCFYGYQPQSEWEWSVFNNSQFNIYPDDVRNKLDRYKRKQVAWVGIIRETEFYDNNTNYEVVILLEHRYFDWKLDLIGYPDIYYPSTEGEGLFQTNWYLKKSADLSYLTERFAPENLAIVYAIPDTVINDIVLVKSKYVRIIDKSNYRADQLNYIPN